MERKHKTGRIRVALTVILAVTAGVLFFVSPTLAATPLSLEDIGGSIGLGTADLKGVILNIIRWLLGILTLVAVSFIIYGAFLWLTAAGNTERIQKAKRVILNAVIGLVIVLLAWAIVFFVARTFADVTGGGDGGPPIPPCIPGDPACEAPAVGFEIRSIATDCGNPPDYRHDVFLCSAVNITFNHLVDANTVRTAVANKKLIIEQCDDGEPCQKLSIPVGSAIDGQVFTDDFPLGAKPEWVAGVSAPGKTVTFYHIPTLFAKDTWFKVTITKDIKDTGGKSITNCRENLINPVPDCTDTGSAFAWRMQTGDKVDATPPKVSSTYPDSRYKSDNQFAPDQSVPRAPIIWVSYDQAIAPIIRQNQPNPRDNTIALIPFTPDIATPDYEDGAEGVPVNPADFTVQMGPDGRTFQIQMKPGKLLEKFFWYKVIVNNVKDLCSNVQQPEPFQWVFETNDIVPGIADHYPRNGADDACADTPIFIRYTMSMYDITNDSCVVDPDKGGYVTAGYKDPATGTKIFNVDPSNDCVGCKDPQNRCSLYSFRPPPPFPPPQDSLLAVGATYSIGVDNRYVINEKGDTLRFGRGPWGVARDGDWDWQFTTKPAGECVNPPVITSIQPPQGTDGQCLSVLGYNFDQEAGYGPSDDLLYDGTPLVRKGALNEQVLSWSDTAIAAEAPSGLPGTHQFKVRAEFPDPFGILESGNFSWEKIAGPASDGPCLISLDPNSGYRGSDYSMHGKRFNPTSSKKDIEFDGIVHKDFTKWDDELIMTKVPLLAQEGVNQVSVQNDAGESNPLPFDVKPIPPDQPVVIDRWPSCDASCINADVGARFSLELDPATLPGSATIKRCTDKNCLAFAGADITPTVTYDGPPENVAHFPPPANLIPDTWYRVVLKKTITATTGGTLGGLNYDDGGVGENNAYSWTFKMQAGAGGCSLGRVDVAPAFKTSNTIPENIDYHASPFSDSESCKVGGQLLNPGPPMGWSWGSNPLFATVAQNAGQPWLSVVTTKSETVPGPATPITATALLDGISKNGTGYLVIDTSSCIDDIDCIKGGLCSGSTCDEVTRRCSPVINSINPVAGDIGTWVSVSGCYFGSYVQGKCKGGADDGKACDKNADCDSGVCDGGSAVIYTNNKRGVWPNPPLCGAPFTQWSPNDILSEVPDRDEPSRNASDGPLMVQRWDLARTSPSAQSFDVQAGVFPPGICKVNPGGGKENTNVTLSGQNFSDAQGTGKVTFFKEKDAAIDSWSDKEVQCVAPLGIENNTDPNYQLEGVDWNKNEIAIKQSGRWSNVKNFDVGQPACAQSCVLDGDCAAFAATPVCGYSGCCVARPKVVSVSPSDGNGNVCRNTVMSAIFDRDMDAGTMNSATVSLLKAGAPVLPITVQYDSGARKMTVSAGLLDRNVDYTVKLTSGVKSAEGGSLAPYQWSFKTADASGPCNVSRIDCAPATWTFPNISTKQFAATAYSDTNLQIDKVPGVYDWDWEWRVLDTTLADVVGPRDQDRADVQAKAKKGRTLVIPAAKPKSPPVGHGSVVEGSCSIDVTVCEQPWIFKDAANNCKPAGESCSDYNFDLSYCRDGGLPNLSFDGVKISPTITGQSGTLLKEFLFKELDPKVKDAIGIRIYDNSEGLSALEWYNKFAPKPGNTSALTVDGYDAVRDGTTVYVAATDFDGARYNPRIYLISYNQGADQKIITIYNEMLQNWFFNNDPNSVAICNSVPEINKTCVQRDLKRLAALGDIKEFLMSYQDQNGSYPKLESGSFLPQLSFSAWPSWQDRLGQDLGKTLGVDPKNGIVDCPAGQAQDGTCWNETEKKFICPSGSHILGYKGAKDGTTARVYANLEYEGIGNWIRVPAETICSAPSSCQCFNYYNDAP